MFRRAQTRTSPELIALMVAILSLGLLRLRPARK
jgi:hypothetical protein